MSSSTDKNRHGIVTVSPWVCRGQHVWAKFSSRADFKLWVETTGRVTNKKVHLLKELYTSIFVYTSIFGLKAFNPFYLTVLLLKVYY